MMTFNMVKSYVTSITNDASGSSPPGKPFTGRPFPSRRAMPTAICRFPMYSPRPPPTATCLAAIGS